MTEYLGWIATAVFVLEEWEAAVARGALKRLGGGAEISRAVIDDGDTHRDAPGSGNNPMMLLPGSE